MPVSIKFKEKTISKILSKEFEFVRVDFYLDKNDNIYFSEFTFTPAAGEQVFPTELEIELSKKWI